MSNTTLLTTPVPSKTHKRIHQIAKENGIPVRTLGRLIFVKAVEDYEKGDLVITTPSIASAENSE